MMEFQDLVSRLALALGIGLLFGLERGWRMREDPAGGRAAGIRTFTISGILGGVLGAVAQLLGGPGGGIALGLGLAVYAAAMAVFCLEQNRAQKDYSATTWVAAMLTVALGAYAVMGDIHAAAALAVGATVILAFREPLHRWLERLTWLELRSALVLLAMTFIALPILPDNAIGPFDGVNPREVWLIAIVLGGVSFIGYAAVKYFGASRGALLAGAAGGLASSTAVTITNARRAASKEGSAQLLAAGVAVANAIMLLRMGAIVSVVNTSLLPLLAPPLLVAAAAAALYALAAVYRTGDAASGEQKFEFRNPFSFWPVVGFALFLGIVIVVGKIVGQWLGAIGAASSAAAIGFVDVDAITIALARLVPHLLNVQEAAIAILVAAATGTIGKVAISAIIDRGRFTLEVAIMAVGCIAVGGVAFWMAYWVTVQ